MEKNITKMKGKKALSMLLALIMVLTVLTPAMSPKLSVTAEAATDNAPDAYATIITASDFQDGRSGNLYEENFSTMMKKAKAAGLNEPDGFILGGDYDGSYADKHDTPKAYKRVESVITSVYPHMNKKNIVNIQGNHDVNDPSVIDKTGPHEFDDYIVYVINNSDYPAGTGGTDAYNKTLKTSQNLSAYFNELKAEGETRPIFIATHVPLHHNSRNPKAENKDANGNVVSVGYNETLYGRVLFDVINENAEIFDIVFLFGHNHSSDYDDYIGGSVNYKAKGELIRISDTTKVPGPDSYTNETLNFTYMNYGYVGYSNNNNETTLTMNTFEICSDKIVATRYSTAGQYGEANIIDRNMKTDVPSVYVDGYDKAEVGSATGAVAITSGFENPVYTWSSTNPNIAEVSGSGRAAEIAYNNAGTATITVKVAESSDPNKNASYRYKVTVSASTATTQDVSIYRSKEQVNGRTLEYYKINLGDTVALSGGYKGFTENASAAWSSSNAGVAKVNQQGLVTFVGSGTAIITYKVTDNGVEKSATVTIEVSTEKKVEYEYIQTDTITAGESYVFATNYNNVTAIYSDVTTTHSSDGVTALSGRETAFEGEAGNYSIVPHDSSYVWIAEKATNNENQVYLRNAYSGLYLSVNKETEASATLGDFVLGKEKPDTGIWQAADGGTVLQTTEGSSWYVRSKGICCVTKNGKPSGDDREIYIFKQVPKAPYANIEFTGEVVNNTTKKIYFATKGRQITLEGDYFNIEKLGSETWSSLNENVATIDQNGVVTFKGVQGETVITYTVTDAGNNNTVTESFTLSAVLTAEKTYWFKYTDKLEKNKEYIIVNKKAATAGSYALAFSGFKVETSKLLADRVDITVEDGVPHIEIPQSFTDVVWTTEDAGNSAFYLKNKGSEEYLNVTTTGATDSSGPVGTVYTNATNEATAGYKWTYDSAGKLYSDLTYTTDGATENVYVRVRSAEFPGTSTQKSSEIYFFEKVGSKPKAIITSSFEAIDEAVERLEVCPSQTEVFTPFADGFDNNNQVTFTWSSSNATIATIDQSGKLTYTGKEGEVAITLTATGTLNGTATTATETVVITVVGGEGYVDPPSDTTYTENAFYKTKELVPGRRYVMHTSYSDAPNLAISNYNGRNNKYVRLECFAIDAPLTDDNGEYVVTENEKIIWICEKSDVPGYYKLRSAEDDQYFFTSESGSASAKRQAGTTVNSAHPEADSVTNAADTLLIRYDQSTGMLHSKQVDDTGSVYGVGNVAKSSSEGYYYIRPTYDGSSDSPVSAITLYEEPVGEAEEKSDKYYLTNNFVAGQKYVFASSNSAGTAYAMNSTSDLSGSGGYNFQKSDEIKILNTDNQVYVTDPSANIIWKCEAVPNETGYFYLKNASNGKYLAVLDDPAKETDLINGSVTTGELNASTLEADEFKLTVVGNKITSKQSQNLDQPYYMYFWGGGYNRYHAKNNSDATVFLYSIDEGEVTRVSVQTEIRKQDDFGSVNITRILQNRYNVKEGYTEQLLQYIRGVASGYTVKWSVSDANIASIDQNGLLTYTGKTGYFNVVLTVTGKDFNGNPVNRTVKTAFNVSVGQVDTRVAVPETVYLAPAVDADGFLCASKIGQVYVNNVMDHDNNYEVKTVAAREDDMYFGLRVAGAKSFTVSVSNATDSSNDIELYNTTTNYNVEGESFNFADGMIEAHGGYGLRFSGAGLQPGEKATAKWYITVTMNDGSTRIYTFYTVMYAPHRTVGAVAESRQVGDSQNEISSWITGANGVDHSRRAPLKGFHGDKSASGYFNKDPLANPDTPPTGGSGETPDDYIVVAGEYSENAYVLQTATNGHDSSMAQSYIGLLTVDKSRYTNTNQIPNLKIGFDALRVGSWKKDSLHTYKAYYTLGDEGSFTSTEYKDTPSGWTEFINEKEYAGSYTLPNRETVIPRYSVSEINGKYIHAFNQGRAYQTAVAARYSNAGTSVLCSVTDKATLREMVVSAYNFTTAENSTFTNALQAAATVLGNPAASQTDIDNASDALYDAMGDSAGTYYALKYDNLFSAFEFSKNTNSMSVYAKSSKGEANYSNGTITVSSEYISDEDPEAYTKYGSGSGNYLIDLKPNTEYVFEYDVVTKTNSQAFMFFYNSEGGVGAAEKDISVQKNGGAWETRTDAGTHWGNYTYGEGTYHYAIKFTTGSNTAKAGFRFGNTGADATTSTFSNIKLIDSAHYYEDAQYSKTEAIYKEYTSYGSLMTPKRPGYSFKGWKDINGGLITGVNTAIDHLTVYSQWNIEKYTVKFDPNGGSGSVSSAVIDIENSATLPETTRGKYTLLGWAFSDDAKTPDIQLGQAITVSDVYGYLDANNKVTLYAVWQGDDLNVTFDNLIDYNAWNKTSGNISEITDTGFTITSDSGAGEATSNSPYFSVTAGKTYRIQADIIGDEWDVYIFFCDDNGSWLDGDYGANCRFSSNGSGNSYKQNGVTCTSEFTAVLDATKAYIRVDANGSNNTVKFSNIRVYEVGTVADGVSYEAPITVKNGKKYGELPIPTRYGFDFKGWYTAAGVPVSEDVIVDSGETINLFSKWTPKPTELVPDTVVIDFGLPVKINVSVNDISVSGGKLTAITKDKPDVTLNTQSYATSQLANASAEANLANGTAEIKDGKVVYTPASTNYTAEEVFYYEYKTANNQYYYTTVTVIPATSIYFEETFMNFKDSGKYKWQEVTGIAGADSQAEDRPGEFTFADADAGNVYGTDAAYDSCTTYSMGKAMFVDVDKDSIQKEPSAEFTFTGTGFDLFSVTDNKAGTIRVYIYKDTNGDGDVADETKHFRNKAISTYYGFNYNTETGQYDPIDSNSTKAVYQVPVIKFRDLGYDTYKVVVKPMYSSGFDVTKAGHYGVYVDSVRIYDPMDEENATANEAYLADGEYAPNYLEIRDTILKKDENGNIIGLETYENSSLFFDGSENNGTVNYAEVGPKNEVYIGPGQAISFKVSSGTVKPSTLQLGMKLIDGTQGKGTVSVFNTNAVNKKTAITLTSATEQFYKLDSVAEWVENNGVYETAYPIVIKNTSDTPAVISLTTLKWAYAGNTAEASSFRLFVDEQTPALAKAAIEKVAEAEYSNPALLRENIKTRFSEEPYTVGDKGILIITTEPGVASVTVDGKELKNPFENSNGTLRWLYKFTTEAAGSLTLGVVATDYDGARSETIYATTYVEEAPADDGETEEPVNPDDEIQDDTTSDSDIQLGGPMDFASNLLKQLFELFFKIINMLSGGVTA